LVWGIQISTIQIAAAIVLVHIITLAISTALLATMAVAAVMTLIISCSHIISREAFLSLGRWTKHFLSSHVALDG
jgi:hypothetical protein